MKFAFPHFPTRPIPADPNAVLPMTTPPEIKAIAHGIPEDELIKRELPALRFIPIVNDHDCEITVHYNLTDDGIWGMGVQLCRIDLDATLEVWPGLTKGRTRKPMVRIEYSDPKLIEKLITALQELYQEKQDAQLLRSIFKPHTPDEE